MMDLKDKQTKARKLDLLVVVDRYPSEYNLYAYMFVHARVKAYILAGMNVKVFYIGKAFEKADEYGFEGVEVIKGDSRLLSEYISNSDPRAIATHFLTPYIWSSLEGYASRIPVYIWLHGAEVQDWTRRYFAFDTTEKKIEATKKFHKNYAFWRELFSDEISKTHFIFVSQYFANEVMDDYDVSISRGRYSVIHNYINETLFEYADKDKELRKYILSIRPFNNLIYANDLTVKAIQELSKEAFFKDLTFTIIGDGAMFDEITGPLHKYKNVRIEKRFVTQEEIASLHKSNGVFLSPGRTDTQGVSRDEAMSSGLVPIASDNSAVPDFVSETEGYLVETEDHHAIASAISEMYHNPEIFLRKSRAAARRVRSQSGFRQTIQKEIDLLNGKKIADSDSAEYISRNTPQSPRERLMRDLLFEVVSNQDKANDELKKVWAKAYRLYRELSAVQSSKSYRIGRRITRPLAKLWNTRISKKIRKVIKAILHPREQLIMQGKSIRYSDLAPTHKVNDFSYPNGKSIGELKIATIMDEFSYNSFKYEADFIQLTPNNWRSDIASDGRPDLLLVESAWRGVNGSWTNKIPKVPAELKEIVGYCQQHEIPTAFWNKEDPVHLVHFIKTASLFDFVFTSDSDSIITYKNILGHSRVYLLPFAAQPVFNNPIEKYDRKDAFVFAGAYYKKFKKRCEDFRHVIEAVRPYKPIHIFDRNYGKNLSVDYQFPEEYRDYVKGTLSYSEIDKAYKGYKYAITMNTIKHSSTMFARRAFELIASNTITVGNYSRGTRTLLGDIAVSSDDETDISNRIKDITSSDYRDATIRLVGLRKVMQEHTYAERVRRVIDKVFTLQKPAQEHAVSVAVCSQVSNESELKSVFDSYARQTYVAKELFISAADKNTSELVQQRSASDPSIHLVDRRDRLPEDQQYVAVFNPGYTYGRHYIEDCVLATNYTDATVIGKSSYFVRGRSKISFKNKDAQYRENSPIDIDKAIAHRSRIKTSFKNIFKQFEGGEVFERDTLSIDGLNLARGNDYTSDEINFIEGNTSLDTGLSIKEVYRAADSISSNRLANTKIRLKRFLRIYKTVPAQEEV